MIGENPGDKAVYPYSDDLPIVTRVPEHDYDGKWAWRFEASRCDETCHHPGHAFDVPRGRAHLTWFTPGTPALIPVEETP